MPQTEKFDESIFKFPRSLPNDLEGFCAYYPHKFPKLMSFFEMLAKKYFKKPAEFKKLIFAQQKELFEGFKKIKGDYDTERNKTDEFLVKIDQRLHKLFAFRFWIVNYGFCDGPVHDYYVERIRHFAELAAEWETIEEKEVAVLDFERALLQGDYADLYLQTAFTGVEVHDFLERSVLFKAFLPELKKSVEEGNLKVCYHVIEKILQYMYDNEKHKDAKKLYELLKDRIANSKVRGDNLEIYNTVIHAFEFYDKSLELRKRFDLMKEKIKNIFKFASKRLSGKDFAELKMCYEMSNLFKEAKDVYGSIDPVLLPFWFGLLEEIAKRYNVPNPVMGHSGMFYLLVWHLPDKLKAIVYTPDLTDFSLEAL